MSFSLLLWKWSDNESPGRAHEIAESLGVQPPPNSLAPFDTGEFLEAVSNHRALSSVEENAIIAEEFFDSEVPANWVVFDIAWSIAPRATKVIALLAHKNGLVVYDPQDCVIPEPCRPKAFCFVLENYPPAYDPTLGEVSQGLAKLNSRSPSFAILESASGSFVQVAGNPEAMTMEWREVSEGSFHHFVATHGGIGFFKEVKIPSSAGFVSARSNQVLSVDEVSPVFSAFLEGTDLRKAFKWDDVTKRFTN